ncbi:MAG: hypothetical protein A3F17_09150 [Gammaproteobacteria bacterium RIFCSPHIGHO2_12_FULL_41_15]|nr:MAG: hypothetical protein A3F17_09150 [Gammaproteobacteria bacterium RIFCSPHIGHO2_12_FULL_41_15]
MKKWIAWTFVVLYLLSLPTLAMEQATTHSTPTPQKLKVGYILGAPFVMHKESKLTGIAIEIWQAIAQRLNLQYSYIPLSQQTDQDVLAIKQNKIDILIGPIVPSYMRTQHADFTRPFITDSIGLVISNRTNFWTLIFSSLKNIFGPILFISFGIMFIYINVIWYIEHKNIPDFPKTYWAGIKYLFWINLLKRSINTPVSTIGKLIHFFWLIVGTVVLSSFYAVLTSTLTSSMQQSIPIKNVHELKQLRLVTIKGSYAENIARLEDIDSTSVMTRKEAFEALDKQKADGMLDHHFIAADYIKQNELQKKYSMSTYVLKHDSYAFALKYGNPLRNQLNLVLADMEDKKEVRDICQRFMSVKDSEHCSL